MMKARSSAATHPTTAPENVSDEMRDNTAEKSVGTRPRARAPIAISAPTTAPRSDHLQTICSIFHLLSPDGN
jgi:3-oxoacyl-ACP reductase-like protein